VQLTVKDFWLYPDLIDPGPMERPMNPTDDLFKPNPPEWDANPRQTFDHWVSQQAGRGTSTRIRISSAEVYRAQWGRFVDWIEQKSIKLSQVDASHVSAFLDSLSPGQSPEEKLVNNRPQRDRYRRLIQRVLADLIRDSAELGVLNPAAQAMRDEGAKWKDVDGNLPTSFLRAAERALLVDHVTAEIKSATAHGQWREARDKAMVGLCLGGGLKVAEIIALTVNCIEFRGPWITLRFADSQYSHRTQPFDYAIQALTIWLQIRHRAGTEGELVFPTDIKPITKNGRLITSINPSTVNRITDTLIHDSGVKAIRDQQHRASPQTLRNTFAAQLFEKGETPALVAEWMGFAQQVSADRMLASWELWRQS